MFFNCSIGVKAPFIVICRLLAALHHAIAPIVPCKPAVCSAPIRESPCCNLCWKKILSSGKGNSSFARFGLHINWWNCFLSPCFNISEFNIAPPLEDSHSDLCFQEFLAIGRLFKNNVWHLGHWHPETPVVGKWGLDGYPGATVSIKLMAVMSFVAWRSPVYCRLFDKVPLSCLFQHFKFVWENEYETLVFFKCMQLEMGPEFSNVMFLQLFFFALFQLHFVQMCHIAHIYIYSWTYNPDMETTSPTMHVILMHHQVVILAAPLTASEVGVFFF